MLYYLKHLFAAGVVFYLSFPVDVAESKGLGEQVTNEVSSSLDLLDSSVPLIASEDVKQRREEAKRLLRLGNKQFKENQFQEAFRTFEKALVIYREIGDKRGEARTLDGIALFNYKLKKYSKALEYYQIILGLTKVDKDDRGKILAKIGQVYFIRKDYPKALVFFERALKIFQELSLQSLNKNSQKNVETADDFLGSSSDIIVTEICDYVNMQNRKNCILKTKKSISYINWQGIIHNKLALVYFHQGKYKKSQKYYSQALAIFADKEINNQIGRANIFNNLAQLHLHQNQYSKAISYLDKALDIFKGYKNSFGIGSALNNKGLIYKNLGQYPQALNFYQQALEIHRKANDETGIGATLHNIGLVYEKLENKEKALKFYQQAVEIRRKAQDRDGEAKTLNNMGLLYNESQQYIASLQSIQQALTIFQELGFPIDEANTLDSLGTVYKSQGKYNQASEAYQKALTISRIFGDRALEAVILSNMGDLLTKQKQPILAIIFYKQSVNITEKIRQNLESLPKEQQKSYTKTVADTYRKLADLLLQQNRVLEAQRVIDLLKVQELNDYLTNVRGNQQTSEGIQSNAQEKEIAIQLATIQGREIELGKELIELRKICLTKCTAEQEKRILKLVNLQKLQHDKFNKFIASDKVKARITQLSQTAQEQNLPLSNIKTLRDNLQKDSVLLYPLILEDRLELVLVTPYSSPISYTTTVKREDLERTIINFRSDLKHPSSDAKVRANKLYQWLIKPIENDLKKAQVKTILYAPDGILRYVPLAALHDGQKWLVERFNTHNITAASIDDLDTPRQKNLRVLAGAFSQGYYSFQVGSQQFDFAGLPFAGKEVENLSKTIENTTKLLNKSFSKKTTVPKMGGYSIVHLATHAAFVDGKPEDSFILFGNGDRVSLRDVENWDLINVDLIVLSACETGLGDNFGNGEEILGFGYLMQQAGAKTAIASLWRVDDGGTQALMNGFYSALKQGKMTKAEALRQAQIALITNDYTAVGGKRGIIKRVSVSNNPSNSKPVTNKLEHPY